MQTRRAVVAGTIALDMIPKFPKDASRREELLVAGKTIYLDDIGITLGGLVANTGIAMSQLGADVTLASKVGGDPLGVVVKHLVEQTGVACKLDVIPELGTSATIVTVPEASDRVFWHRRGASQEYSADDLDEDMLAQADLFHFGYPTGMRCMYTDGGKRLEELYRKAKAAGLTTSMDLSIPGLTSESAQADWKHILAQTLPYTDIFMPSLEETLFLFRREYYLDVLARAGSEYAVDYIDLSLLQQLGDEMLALGTKVFGLKLGKKGIYLRTADAAAFDDFGALRDVLDERWWNRELLEPPYQPEQICSTNGAGDTAIAGFLTGIMSGWTPECCLKLAAGAAASRIESPRAVQAVYAKEKVMQRVAGGWRKLAVEGLNSDIWRWDAEKATYFGRNDALIRV